jgi:hypothetical protein
MLIYNIFLETSQFENYNVTPLLNGLSDHYAQMLTIFMTLIFQQIQSSQEKLINIQYTILLMN